MIHMLAQWIALIALLAFVALIALTLWPLGPFGMGITVVVCIITAVFMRMWLR